MTGASRRKRVQAVLFSVIMVVSMVAVGVGGLAGSAAADEHVVTVGTSDGDDYSSIQAAIDGEGSDSVIELNQTEYDTDTTIDAENVTLRGGDSTPSITGEISVESDHVSISGIEINNPSAGYGIRATGVTGLTVEHSTISDIGTETDSSAQAVYLANSSGTIHNNTISNVSNGNSESSKGIFVGDSDEAIEREIEITENDISDVSVDESNFDSGGVGAYGVLVNADLNDKLTVTGNDISDLSGLWVHGIGLEGDTPNAEVSGNDVRELSATKGDTSDEDAYRDEAAIFFEANPSADTVSVSGNSFDNLAYGTLPHPEQSTSIGTITVVDGPIQTAVDHAAEGDTIEVSPGTYEESISINTPNLTIKGPNAESYAYSDTRSPEAYINASGSENTISVGSELGDVTIEGITINGTWSQSGIVQGMSNKSGTSTHVINNTIYAPDSAEAHGNSIQVSGDNSVVSGNEVKATKFPEDITDWSTTGILVVDGDDVLVSENYVYDGKNGYQSGIGVVGWNEPANDTVVENNIVEDLSGSAVSVQGHSQRSDVQRNRLNNSTYGITVYEANGENPSEVSFSNNSIVNNEVSANTTLGGSVDATENWWGSESGPADDKIEGNFQVEPWLDASADEGGEAAVAAKVNGEDFSTIQSAVSAAKDGDTVIIQSGVHSENITVSTPNVTIDGQGSAVIDGRIDIPVDEVTVTNLTVQNGARAGSEAEGIFIGNAEGFDDLDGNVTLRNVVIEDVHGHGTGSTVEGVHVKYYDNGDEIYGITFDNLTVRNVTQTAAGADGVKLQAEVNDVSITNSTFSDIEGAWAYGVVSTPSSVEMGVPDDVTLRRNTIEDVTATEYSGVGIGIDGKDENGYADASDVRVTQNDFLDNDIDILNKEPDASPMFAPLNYFGENGPNVTGSVFYDPVLTTSEENVVADSPRNVSEYGSVLELNSDESRALAVGFSARPDEPVGEIFGEMDITGNAFVYDNEAGEYQDISGDHVPSVGEVVVLTSEGAIDETVTVPIETNVDNEAATPESVSLSNGWNLVATGGTVGFDSNTLDIAGAEVQNDLQLQAQASQPGLPEASDEVVLGEDGFGPNSEYTGAFEGTWLFVDDEPDSDAQLATGYAEDQSAEEYVFEVLHPNDPQAEYPEVPRAPGYPPELGLMLELIYENPDLILEEEARLE